MTQPDSTTNTGDVGALARVEKYCDAHDDAMNWGGPTIYPPRPLVRDLRALIAALRATPTPASEAEVQYLVWSNEHKAWWGADRCGYTRVIARAGRYSRYDALSIAGVRDGGWHVRKGNPDEIAIPEQDAIDQYISITRAQQSAMLSAVPTKEPRDD